MKKTLTYLALNFLTVILVSNTNAQTDVKIMDFSVLQQHNMNQPQSDSVELHVSFKINKANKAGKVHFWLGTADNKSDVYSAAPTFVTSGGTTSINYNGNSQVINGYQTGFKVKLSKQQYDAYIKATLFVETTDGQFTTRLFYKK